jgi:NAD(P)-dependent dehydrogenase (short-subunit alcohol dehydrogenase family)
MNIVFPGTTETPTTKDWLAEYRDKVLKSYALGRIGEPQDIADTVVFLASDAADWVTAEVISVNGGYIRG